MPLYRRLRFGDLVELNLLDTRQYRDDQPCDGDGGGGRVVTCPERVDPRRTILGDHQRRWLLRGLDRSQARWNVLAQQVVMAELDLHPGPGRAWWSDAWDGYAADRDRILRFLWDRQPANLVVLTGDIHAFLVNELRLPGRGPDAPMVATELVGTSISSGASKSSGFRRHLADNPHVRFFEPPARLHPLHGDPRALVRRPAGGGHGRAPRSAGPHPRPLGCGKPSTRCGTGLEWRTLTTTYGGAWVRP